MKSRLYWKVIANFGLLVVVITIMGFLTLNILAQIERSFNLASRDISFLNNLESVRHFLEDMPAVTDEYLATGSSAARAAYEKGVDEFDAALSSLQQGSEDSITVGSLRAIRDMYFGWRKTIGDQKIRLREQSRSSKTFESATASLRDREAAAQYLPQARNEVRDLYKLRINSQPKRIEKATELAGDLATYVGMINILLAVFAVTLGFVLTRSITKPVRLLAEGTKGMMSGKFEPIDLHRSDELGKLADDFNRMSVMLGNNYTRLNAYSELVTALNQFASVEDVESKSLQIICQHVGANLGALYALDRDRDILELAAGYGLQQRDGARTYRLGEGIPGQCALDQKILQVDDVPPSSGLDVDTGLVAVAPRYVIAVPILFQDRVLGVIVLGSMQPFDELKREILTNSVPQIGVAITNARNYESAQNLSREIAKKNEELNQKNIELEKAYRIKSDFLSSMSHELRTPLNSIIGFSSILLGPHGDPLTNDQRMAMDKVLKNGKHLLQLINDILDFSKIEAGRMPINIETDEVGNVVTNSILTVEAMVRSKNLTLTQAIAPDVPLLRTDVLKIRQILVNLLSNAAKFTEQGGISITVTKKNGLVCFEVRDSGIGVERKNLDLVFQEFQQIDSGATRKYQGTGLGLPISRRLARMLGGDLTVDSEFEKGSTFTFLVPAVFPEELKSAADVVEKAKRAAHKPPEERPKRGAGRAEDRQPIPADTAAAGGSRILCIDDDPDVLEILRNYLVPEGYVVVTALSGVEGLEIAAKTKPALITLDIMMPDKDGWEVLRELKHNTATRDIPVLIHSMIDNKPLALSLGAVDVIPKPVDPKRLLDLVGELCTSKDEYVLIVDDSEDFCDALRKFLEDDGYTSKVAYNGKQALEKISESVPALILLDLIMPVMDGFELVRRMQAHDSWKNVPVVILSGKELSKSERQELNDRVAEYMHKSDFSREAISKTINRVLGNNRH